MKLGTSKMSYKKPRKSWSSLKRSRKGIQSIKRKNRLMHTMELVQRAANDGVRHLAGGREYRDVGIGPGLQQSLTVFNAQHPRRIQRGHANAILKADFREAHHVA